LRRRLHHRVVTIVGGATLAAEKPTDYRYLRRPHHLELTLFLAGALAFHLCLIASAFFLPPPSDLAVDLSTPGEANVTGVTSFLSGRQICMRRLFESAKKSGAAIRVRVWDDGKGYREFGLDDGEPVAQPQGCVFVGWGARSYRVHVEVLESGIATKSETGSVNIGIPRAAVAIDFWVFVVILTRYHLLAIVAYWLLGMWRLWRHERYGRTCFAEDRPGMDRGVAESKDRGER
jgi:hypothetical protein